MPAVEIRIARAKFADTLGAMRDWLDHNASGPVKFETASEAGGTILIRVEFARTELAQEFAAEFPGSSASALPLPQPLATAAVGKIE
jgi:hypothetical protein